MDAPAVAADRVRVEASGLFPRRHRLLAGETLLGELAFGLSASAFYVDAEGRALRMARVSPWRAEYRMWEGGEERASARLRLLQRRIDILFEGQSFQFWPTSLRLTSWGLGGADGEPVLMVRRSGWGQAEIEIYAPVDADLLAFTYYLFVIGRRSARRRH